MSVKLYLLVIIYLTVVPTNANVILSNPKNQHERVTSLAVTQDQVFFTLYDSSKESGVNALLYHNKLKSPSQDLFQVIFPHEADQPISPISVRIDKCQRLWILDCGVQNISGYQDKTAHPKIQGFNIKTTDEDLQLHLIAKFVIPSSYDSLYANFLVDVLGDSCSSMRAMIYIADFNGRKLLVYDVKNNSSRFIKHNFFNPDPFSNVPLKSIFNKQHRSSSGVLGLAKVGPDLLFHPLASRNDFLISLYLLRLNQSVNYNDITFNFQRPYEATSVQFDENQSVLFYAALTKLGYRSVDNTSFFNIEKKYCEIDIGLQSGLLADLQVVGSNLYTLGNNETDFFIEVFDTRHLIEDSSCNKVDLVNIHYTSNYTDYTYSSAKEVLASIVNLLFVYLLSVLVV